MCFHFRQQTIKKMRKLCRDGQLTPFIADESPQQYIDRMKVSGTFVDELFLTVMASVLESDILLLHLNRDTASNGVYTWLKGGEFLSETSGPKCPLFFGNVLYI